MAPIFISFDSSAGKIVLPRPDCVDALMYHFVEIGYDVGMADPSDIVVLVVLTGGGILAESGLATLRGSGGLWEGQCIEKECPSCK